MPIVFAGKTRCAISGKVIEKGDIVMGFHLFPYYPPPHPLSVCYDNVAFREEFDKWEFKEQVIQELSEIWTHHLGVSDKYHKVIFKDEDYIISMGVIDPNIGVWFLKHLFIVGIPKPIWKTFCQRLTANSPEISITLTSTTSLLIKRGIEAIEIFQTSGDFSDKIQLSSLQWSNFLMILTMIKELPDSGDNL